ncbi:MAG: pyrophosphokinae [Pyrinomonadaceae bacterium]|jgi:ppGpp synthetase/RelA/SpoT-type nucleotidyltranferase|nr:pyrophosphokinae [Pyrinomonadaceae bacterium]
MGTKSASYTRTMIISPEFSRSQIDRLGDRLRKDAYSDEDLRLLDSYRRAFAEASEHVVKEIRNRLGLEPTARPAKSKTSIADKLRRESIRLSQIQDIAGCRLTVEDIFTQDEVVGQLKALFEDCTVVDRREHSSHGYRAVHIIIPYSGKLIEVQVRTQLQHRWAELSEKLSDVIDPSIKYGEGDKDVLLILAGMSDRIKEHEKKEAVLAQLVQTEGGEDVIELALDVYDMKEDISRVLNAIDEDIAPAKGREDDLSD